MGKRVKAWRVELLPTGDQSAEQYLLARSDSLPVHNNRVSQLAISLDVD